MQEQKVYQMAVVDSDEYLVSFVNELEEGAVGSLLFCVKLSSLAEICKPDAKIAFPFFIKGGTVVNVTGVKQGNVIRFRPPDNKYSMSFAIRDNTRYTYKGSRSVRMVELEPLDVESMDSLYLDTGCGFVGHTSL